jgi:hypothetical protein
LEKAQRNAARSNSGSELLLFVEEALKVIDTINPDLGKRLLDDQPELGRRLKDPPHPVVLELTNIEASRITGENGDPIDQGLIDLVERVPGVGQQLSFRILNVSRSDVCGVYDLMKIEMGSGARFGPGGLSRHRTTPADWLSRFTVQSP